MAPRIDYLSDPHFVIVEDVPILDEHDLFVPGNPEKGTQDRTIKLTPEFLQEIAANNNRAAKETGDLIPIIEGHTRDNVPESEQPEILGFADNFHVGPLFETGRAAILSRWKISKDPRKMEKAKRLPRRSVELWLDRREINPIAMLGATAPERNLGLLCLSRSGSYRAENGKLHFRAVRDILPFRYTPEVLRMNAYGPGTPCAPGTSPVQMQGDVSGTGTDNRETPYTPTATPGTGQPANVDPALVQAVVAALEQTDAWKQMQAFMQQMQAQQPQPGMPMPGQQPGMSPEMGGQQDPMALLQMLGMGGGGMGGEAPEDEPQTPRKADEKVPMQGTMPGMGGGLPGSNTFLPGMEPTDDRTTYPPRMKMDSKSYMRPGETAEQCIVRLARERDEALMLSRTNKVLVELTALIEREGIPLDASVELPRLQAMDDAQREAEYQRLRDMHVRYQRMMGGQVRTGKLPTLIPGQEEPPEVPGSAVGVRTPDRRMQREPDAVEAPMTAEEKEPVMQFIMDYKARTGKTLDARDVVRMLRTGQVVMNGRTPVERVY